MDINQKLQRLTEGVNKSALARDAGLRPTQLGDYTNKGFKPRYDIAFKLAKVLHVDPVWLMDDNADWPPKKQELSPLSETHDFDLILEVARRLRQGQERVLRVLADAENMDWRQIAETIEHYEGGELPAVVHQARRIIQEIQVGYLADQIFDPQKAARTYHTRLPGKDRPLSEFGQLESRLSHLWRSTDYSRVEELLKNLDRRAPVDSNRSATASSSATPAPPIQAKPQAPARPVVSSSPQASPSRSPAPSPHRSKKKH